MVVLKTTGPTFAFHFCAILAPHLEIYQKYLGVLFYVPFGQNFVENL